MILIPIKQVPDSWSEKVLDTQSRRLAREQAEPVLNDLDEFAVEAGLQLAESHSLPSAVVTIGPEPAKEALLKVLSMGVDVAYHVQDPAFIGACFHQTSSAIAAVAKMISASLVITGLESTDGKGAVIPAMVGSYLDWPSATSLTQLSLQSGIIEGTAVDSQRIIRYSIALPCVISVAENSNEPRFPSFKGIMAAKKKVIHNLTLSDLKGFGFDEVLSNPSISVDGWIEAPPRSRGEQITDIDKGISILSTTLRATKE